MRHRDPHQCFEHIHYLCLLVEKPDITPNGSSISNNMNTPANPSMQCLGTGLNYGEERGAGATKLEWGKVKFTLTKMRAKKVLAIWKLEHNKL